MCAPVFAPHRTDNRNHHQGQTHGSAPTVINPTNGADFIPKRLISSVGAKNFSPFAYHKNTPAPNPPLRAAAGALSSAGDKDGPLSERQRVSVHPHAGGISGGYPQGWGAGCILLLTFLVHARKVRRCGPPPTSCGYCGEDCNSGDHPLFMHSHAGAWERD